MSFFDWVRMGAALLFWVVAIALVGYAAALVAWWRHA